jgi:hypothetical protein
VLRLVERLNAWLERRPRLVAALDRFNRAVWTFWAVLFALTGAAIAGYALTQGWAGVLFAIPVAIGAWMMLKWGRPE